MEIRGMTGARLREAIRANDPDGEGEARVIAAARRRLDGGQARPLSADDTGSCVLAFGWQAPYVLFSLFRPFGAPICDERDHSWDHYRDHEFGDVVEWFDTFNPDFADGWQRAEGHRDAAQAVLTLLGAKEPE